MRRFRPWSLTWWLDNYGHSLPNIGALWLFSVGSLAATFLMLLLGRPGSNLMLLLRRPGSNSLPAMAAVVLIAILIASLVVFGVYGLINLAMLFLGIPGRPSSGVVGQPLFGVSAMSGRFSDGDLLVTADVVAYVPGAYRWSGKCDSDETEVVIPLREIAQLKRHRVYWLFPFGLTIVRNSGDEERFTVGRPEAVMIEIENAVRAWKQRQREAEAAEAQQGVLDGPRPVT